MSKQLTAREFVVSGTTGDWKCPVCGSTDIEWGEMTVDTNCFYQEAQCGGCGAHFNTIYRLVGFMVDGSGEACTITEDFGEVTSIEEPRNPLWDELFKANTIIRKLAKLVRHYGYKEEMPDLRINERAAVLRKGA